MGKKLVIIFDLVERKTGWVVLGVLCEVKFLHYLIIPKEIHFNAWFLKSIYTKPFLEHGVQLNLNCLRVTIWQVCMMFPG